MKTDEHWAVDLLIDEALEDIWDTDDTETASDLELKAKLPLDNVRLNNPYFWRQFTQVKDAVDELYDEYVDYTKD